MSQQTDGKEGLRRRLALGLVLSPIAGMLGLFVWAGTSSVASTPAIAIVPVPTALSLSSTCGQYEKANHAGQTAFVASIQSKLILTGPSFAWVPSIDAICRTNTASTTVQQALADLGWISPTA